MPGTTQREYVKMRNEQKIVAKGVVLSALCSALLVYGASAEEPKVLTPAQMNVVTAGGYDEDYNDATGRASGNGTGGSYADESRLARHRLNNSGSGANTSDGGSYSTRACCT